MTGKTGIHFFTDEDLRERDKNIAAKVHQLTVLSTTRKLLKMNSGQQLNASRKGGKSLCWSEEKLDKVLAYIDGED